MTIRTLRTSLRMFVVCLFAASMMHAAPSRADDYTDIWWAGPAEDGWGVNLIQSQDFIFATFFVYGPAPATTPIWYVGNLARQGSVFTGGLFQTMGTGFGVPWNPLDHHSFQVGTATFNPIDSSSATLDYSVNGVAVHKSIVRQTLTQILIGGSYYGTAVIVTSGCMGTETKLRDFDPVVAQTTTGQVQMDFTFGGDPDFENCTFSGTLVQEGLLFRIPAASYVCRIGTTTTVNSTATIYEMKLTSIGLEGRWFTPNVGGGCTEDAKFATIFP